MADKLEFDEQAAHRYFSVSCFNQAWDLMDKDERTREDEEQMIRLSLASHWHWTQREDFTKTNESVAHWQTSRIYALLGQAENARHYGELSLAAASADGVAPFYVGYAYEALARAESIAGDNLKAEEYLSMAHEAAKQITDAEERKMLEDDLGTITCCMEP